MIVDDERRAGDDARQAAAILERKRTTLQAELEDIRALYETVRLYSAFFHTVNPLMHKVAKMVT